MDEQKKFVLRVENLVTSFVSNNRKINAVDDCSFNVEKGKILGIVGESGCGKSVTSLSIMGLLPKKGKVTSGQILFNDKNLLSFSDEEIRKIRGHKMSMIFQEPMTSLNPVYTVGDQIAEVFMLHQKLRYKEAIEASIEMLKQVRISSPEKRINDYPHQLSGGMRQRIMIAMALSCKPDLLIADEPTTALDVTIQAQILALISALQKKNNMSTILITHDLGVVAQTCDNVVVMYAGKIVESGTVKEILESPKHPYTLALLKAIPRIGTKKSRLYAIPGMVANLADLPKGCRFQDRCAFAGPECTQAQPDFTPLSTSHKAACFKLSQL